MYDSSVVSQSGNVLTTDEKRPPAMAAVLLYIWWAERIRTPDLRILIFLLFKSSTGFRGTEVCRSSIDVEDIDCHGGGELIVIISEANTLCGRYGTRKRGGGRIKRKNVNVAVKARPPVCCQIPCPGVRKGEPFPVSSIEPP